MNPNDEHLELDHLLLEWQDGSLDDAGLHRLREILRGDESARKHFVQVQRLDAALKFESETPEIENDTRVFPAADNDNKEQSSSTASGGLGAGSGSGSGSSNTMLTVLAWGSLAAAILFGAFAIPAMLKPNADNTATNNSSSLSTDSKKTEITSSGVALLTRLVDVKWEDESEIRENGSAIKPGIIAIKSGIAQLEFFCGATVILEGPAKFEIVSSTEATMHRGRLRAEVPPAARGFAIKTSNFDVVDLGTEFGLSVTDDTSDVQVFDGEVEIHPESGDTKLISSGKAVRHENGELIESELTPDEFISLNDLEDRNETQHRLRYKRWKEHSAKLRQDERLVVYYAFDEPNSNQRTLVGSMEQPNEELNGAIVGADHVTGRWAEKGALEFKHPGDRIRVQIPGEFESLTFATWVRIDSLDRWYNSLFLTDSYDRGEPHWQILDTGQLFLSVRISEIDDSPEERQRKRHEPVLSEPFWNPSKSGQWFHLATIYNNETDTVSHFVNGERITHTKLPERVHIDKLRIGKSSIGNWSEPYKPGEAFVIRNLNGRIDEFAIFSAALSPDEIGEMYRNGKQ